MTTQQLSVRENRILGAIKVNTVFTLLSVLSETDGELQESLKDSRFCLRVSAPGVAGTALAARNGRFRHYEGGGPLPSLTLRFFRPEHLTALFSGKKAPVIPLPGNPAFLNALKTFQAGTARLQQIMSAAPEEGEALYTEKTRLLLAATVTGIRQVARGDLSVRAKFDHIARGTIELFVEEEPSLAWHLVKQQDDLLTFPGRPAVRGNAQLSFRTVAAAHDLLTGKLNAMAALGTSEVKIRGKLPMVQNLFPLLDRLGFYMSVQ